VLGFSVKDGLFLALMGATLFHLVSWWRGPRAARSAVGVPPEALDCRPPSAFQLAIGFVSNFFDTLGIGSFAPTTTVFTFARMVPVRLIPGTLNVGDTLPTIAEAFIFIAIVAVDPATMISLIAAAVGGAWLGAGIVAGWSKRRVQLGMGLALLAAAVLMTLSILHIGFAGGTALSLHGMRFAIGMAGNFLLGVLMTMGIGLYAPCLILITLLGMDPLAAFPIMMGSCAFLMPVSGARFVRRQCYARRPALGLALGGVPGVLVAAYVVKSLPLLYVRWLVIVVVVYAAIAMLSAAVRDKRAAVALEA
jgi:uncharacterized membrane protein YfcA